MTFPSASVMTASCVEGACVSGEGTAGVSWRAWRAGVEGGVSEGVLCEEGRVRK